MTNKIGNIAMKDEMNGKSSDSDVFTLVSI